MTIRHLKIFITVADQGTMSKAAEELYISQPSVSQAIQELETYYGIKLFERLARKIYLTDSGEELLSYARYVVEAYEAMDLAMKNRGSNPTLRIGSSVTVGTCLINPIIDRLEEELPGIDVHVEINNTSYIENMILKSQLDVAIVEGIINNEGIVSIPLLLDELVIVVGKIHELYGKESASLEELEGQVLIAREKGSMDRNQYEKVFSEHGISLKTIWNSTNTEAIKNAVISGKGLAILSKMLIKKEVELGELHIVKIEDVKVCRDIHLIYHKGKYLSKTIKRVIDISKKLCKERVLH